MKLQQLVRHAQLYAKSTGFIAEIRLATHMRKMCWAVVAGGLVIFGLAMLNLSLYHALAQYWGIVWTPLALGLGNLAVAACILLRISQMSHGPELEIAETLRSSIAIELENDLDALRDIPSLMTTSLDAGAARVLVPAIGAIIKALRQRKSSAPS